jgi:hypothetical protein
MTIDTLEFTNNSCAASCTNGTAYIEQNGEGKIKFQNSNFTGNSGTRASAIYGLLENFEIDTITFSTNTSTGTSGSTFFA